MDPVAPPILDQILNHFIEKTALFSGIATEVAILDNRKGQEKFLSMFSVKAPYYLALYSEESERYQMNAGYVLEQMVLYMWTLGLSEKARGLTQEEQWKRSAFLWTTSVWSGKYRASG